MHIEKEIVECGACKLRSGCRTPLTPLSTYQDIQLVVVVEKPTFEEESCAWEFGDRHHQWIRKVISRVFRDNTVHYTYLTKCFSGTEVKIGKRNSKICLEKFLLREIEMLKPPYLLSLGKNVSTILGGEKLGEITKSSYGYVGYYKSASTVYNAGIHEENKFLKFLNKLKGTNV